MGTDESDNVGKNNKESTMLRRGELEVRIREGEFARMDSYSLFIMERGRDEEIVSVGKLTMEAYIPGTVLPTYDVPSISRRNIQKLFNDLWLAGFRPTDGTGNSGHIGALNRHLEDMRVIVANKLGVEFKK